MESTMMYDLVIIGGGIAGLSAAINAASEGLSVVVLEGSVEFGGQARTVKQIRNLVGYPDGISGKDLIARTLAQARDFGVQLMAPFRVTAISPNDAGDEFEIKTSHDRTFHASSVLITAGVRYRRLEVANVSSFLGHGVSYGELPDDLSDKRVFIVGGGNSAGQAALAVSDCENCDVFLLVRGELSDGHMSNYLIDGIRACENIEVKERTEVIDAHGRIHLERLTLKSNVHGNQWEEDADRLLISIGAEPHVQWAARVTIMDDKGFILTGASVAHYKFWEEEGRPPFRFETTQGIFVAGDVESGSNKRVATAIGNGSGAVASILQYLGRR